MSRATQLSWVGCLGLGTFLALSPMAQADQVVVKINAITAQGVGETLGSVTLSDGADGMKLAFGLHNMPPGDHGMHVHENASCMPADSNGQMMAGMAAGEHYDPDHAGHHMGPNGQGHMGDLEVISVDDSGVDTEITTAKRLHVSDVRGHSIVIHMGGDNYADEPAANGGGGERIACGVVPK